MILDHVLPTPSARITLTPPSEADDVAIAALRCHPETRRYVRFLPEHFTPKEARDRRVARATDTTLVDFTIHALDPEGRPTLAGSTGIFGIDDAFRACESGIVVAPECHRGGVATAALCAVLAYAFEARGMHRVTFMTTTDNVGMRGWLESAGAVLEGVQRAAWPDGAGGWTDACTYSILEEEWGAVKAGLEERIGRAEQRSGA
ncbi:acyl-CoA N-acyltransferase [Mycena sp. CBHHK59/15]|nr:acyl-CoA N-acyltransferase [Mycena sp. CBHHK59/15]